MEHTNQIEN